MYERKEEPLASSKTFVRRLGLNGLIGALLLAFSLGIGMLGYHFLENLSWIDSLLDASMILGGMGPVDPMKTNAGKIFASLAIYSGVILLASVGILIAPIFHRFLHHFHLAEEDE